MKAEAKEVLDQLPVSNNSLREFLETYQPALERAGWAIDLGYYHTPGWETIARIVPRKPFEGLGELITADGKKFGVLLSSQKADLYGEWDHISVEDSLEWAIRDIQYHLVDYVMRNLPGIPVVDTSPLLEGFENLPACRSTLTEFYAIEKISGAGCVVDRDYYVDRQGNRIARITNPKYSQCEIVTADGMTFGVHVTLVGGDLRWTKSLSEAIEDVIVISQNLAEIPDS